MRRMILGFLWLVATASYGALFVVFWLEAQANPAAYSASDSASQLAIVYSLLLVGWLLNFVVLIDSLVHLAQWRQWGWFVLLGLGIVGPLSFLYLPIALPIYLVAGPKVPPSGGVGQSFTGMRVPQGAPDLSGRAALAEKYALAGWSLSAASRYASWYERVAAFVIDLATIIAVGIPLGLIANIGYELISATPEPPNTINLAEPLPILLGLAAIWLLFNGTVFVVWPLQWTRTGQTFGQRAARIRVVTTGVRRVRFGAAFVRALCMFSADILILGIPVGWLWMLVDPRRQTWHDKIAGTVVIRESPAANGGPQG